MQFVELFQPQNKKQKPRRWPEKALADGASTLTERLPAKASVWRKRMPHTGSQQNWVRMVALPLPGCASPTNERNVHAPTPEFACANPLDHVTALGGGASGRRLGHEGAALAMGFAPLLEGSQRALPPPCEETSHLPETRHGLTPEPDRAGALISHVRPLEM